jgi:hypothetical protein
MDVIKAPRRVSIKGNRYRPRGQPLGPRRVASPESRESSLESRVSSFVAALGGAPYTVGQAG